MIKDVAWTQIQNQGLLVAFGAWQKPYHVIFLSFKIFLHMKYFVLNPQFKQISCGKWQQLCNNSLSISKYASNKLVCKFENEIKQFVSK